jgi:hypothetical protein
MPAKQRRWEAVVSWFRSRWGDAGGAASGGEKAQPRWVWDWRPVPCPMGGGVRAATGDAGYLLGQGFYMLGVPSGDFAVRAVNLGQGITWFARGMEEVRGLGAGPAAVLAGVAGAAGVGAVVSASLHAERGLVGSIRGLSALSGLSLRDSTRQQEIAAALGVRGAPEAYAAYVQRASMAADEQLLAERMRGGRPGFYSPAFVDPLARYGLSAFDFVGGVVARPRPFEDVLFAAALDVAKRRRTDPLQAAVEAQLVGMVLLGSSTALARVADRIDAAAASRRRFPASLADVLPPAGVFGFVDEQQVEALRVYEEKQHELGLALRSLAAAFGVALVPVVAAFLRGVRDGVDALRDTLGFVGQLVFGAPGMAPDQGGAGGGLPPGLSPPSSGGWGQMAGPVGGGGVTALTEAGRLVAWGLAGVAAAVALFVPLAIWGLVSRIPLVRGLLTAIGAVFGALWQLLRRLFPAFGGLPGPGTPPFAPACQAETAQWGLDVARQAQAWADAVIPLASRAGALDATVEVRPDFVLDPGTSDQPLKLRTQWPTAVPQIVAQWVVAPGVQIPDVVFAAQPAIAVSVTAAQAGSFGQTVSVWEAWRALGAPAVAVTTAASLANVDAVVQFLAVPAVAGTAVVVVQPRITWVTATTFYRVALAPPSVSSAVVLAASWADEASASLYGAFAQAAEGSMTGSVVVTEATLKGRIGPANVVAMQVSRIGARSVLLDWKTDASGGIEAFRFYKARPGEAWQLVQENPVDNPIAERWWETEIGGLQPQTQYDFAIACVWGGAQGNLYQSGWVTTTAAADGADYSRVVRDQWYKASPDDVVAVIESSGKILPEVQARAAAIPATNRPAPAASGSLTVAVDASSSEPAAVVEWTQHPDTDAYSVMGWNPQKQVWVLLDTIGAALVGGATVAAKNSSRIPLRVITTELQLAASELTIPIMLLMANGELQQELSIDGRPLGWDTRINLSWGPLQGVLNLPLVKPDLQAIEVAYGWVVLSWGYPGNTPVVGFNLYGAPKGGNLALIASLPASARKYQVDHLAMNTTYVFRLRPITSNGIEVATAEIEVTTKYAYGDLAQVENLHIYEVERGGWHTSAGEFANTILHYTWSDPKTELVHAIVGYRLTVASDSGESWTIDWPYGPPFHVFVYDDGKPGWVDLTVRVLYASQDPWFPAPIQGAPATVRYTFYGASVPATPSPAGWTTGYDIYNGSYADVTWTTVAVDTNGQPTEVTGYSFARKGPGDADWVIERDANGNVFMFDPAPGAKWVSHLFSKLQPGVQYEFVCHAHNAVGASGGAPIAVTSKTAPFVMPGVKLDGVAMADDAHVQLGWEVVPEWQAFPSGAPAYPIFYLYWRLQGTAYLVDQRLEVDGSQRTGKVPLRNGIADLVPGQTYFFQIVYAAWEAASTYSMMHYAKSNELYLTIPDVSRVPAAPDVVAPSIRTIASYNGLVHVVWDYDAERQDPPGNPSSFKVMRAFLAGDTWTEWQAASQTDAFPLPGTAGEFWDYDAWEGYYAAYYVVAQGRDGAGIVRFEAASQIRYVLVVGGDALVGQAGSNSVQVGAGLDRIGAEAAVALFAETLRSTLAAAGIG